MCALVGKMSSDQRLTVLDPLTDAEKVEHLAPACSWIKCALTWHYFMCALVSLSADFRVGVQFLW